jgi:hypothetical protein
MRKILQFTLLLFLLFCGLTTTAQNFIHPGGLHTKADLDRMKAQVAAGAHPWIDSWNALIAHPKAQNTYTAAARANMGEIRQRASADAVAAYLNALRWYISGDTSYAACARRICNAWAYAVNQVPSGQDIPGLMGIAIYEFAVAAEILRLYPNWSSTDFNQFKSMMTTYLYPVCDNFLTNHRGTCISHYWANWDICNMNAILGIGVLCDDTAKFNQAITYFKSGAGNGNITKAVPFLHPGGLGQWQETGRDQEHALLGLGMMASFCQIAWNQGQDLYGYDNNRLLAGAEYTAKYNLWKDVPYTTYNNCDNVYNLWASEQNSGGRGRLQRPIWEMIYNHYVVRKGLSAPHVKAMAEVNRPEGFVHDDNIGFGTLCYTLDAAASPYPASPAPTAPTGLKATASVGKVWLRWDPVATATGYNILRATTSGGPYTTIATNTGTYPLHEDAGVTNGTTYYYVVSARNQAGTSANTAAVSATPAATGALPSGWAWQDLGTVVTVGSAGYANVSNGTFVVNGSGAGIGGTADGVSYVYRSVTGDATITARVAGNKWSGGGSQKTGIMIRESLAANAIAFSMTSGDAGAREARFGRRTSTGGSMSFQTGNLYTHAPTWFRLQRAGNTFTAYQSTDGRTWFAIGSPFTVSMANTYYVGLAVSSNSSNVNTTTYDSITVTSGPIANGTYRIINRNSGKVLDVANGSTANGANVHQWPWLGGANQQWNVADIGNGQYSIAGVQSGKYLDVNSASTADGANVHIWPNTGGNNQKFTFTLTDSNYFRIAAVHSGKVVEVAGGSVADGANVQQWTWLGGANQQWKLVPVSNTSNARSSETVTEPQQALIESNDVVLLYPNPAAERLTLQFPNDLINGMLKVSDAHGHTIYNQKISGSQSVIPTNKLSAGVYFIQINKGSKTITKKFIKK